MLGFPEGEVQARAVAETAKLPYAAIDVHHFPDGESRVRLAAAGVTRVWSSDSVPHPTNRIRLASLLAAALQEPDRG